MNYTKGEWYWEYNDQQHHNLRAKSTHPSGCEEDKHILFVAPDFLGEDSLVNDADAQLIAAAPDLYEALKDMATCFRNIEIVHSIQDDEEKHILQGSVSVMLKALAKVEDK